MDHARLFSVLEEKHILDSKEIQLLRAIYCRTSIELGNESLRPNVGVAQGSIISPYLFNVYAEDMLLALQADG